MVAVKSAEYAFLCFDAFLFLCNFLPEGPQYYGFSLIDLFFFDSALSMAPRSRGIIVQNTC